MSTIAILTARGGSKRIPRKNIRLFHGRPILAYGIEAALRSTLFSEVMVSTDDTEIADVARQYGASVPFLRTAQTADDYATTADVLTEVLEQYEGLNKKFDYACCIYPTAPFITAQKLQEAFEQLRNSNADVVLPVVKYSTSIWRSLNRQQDGKLAFYWPENAVKRSQDLPDAYYDCGQFYFFSVQRFLQTKNLLTNNAFGLPVPELEVHDIDNEDDWKMAEFKYFYSIKKQQ